MDALDLRLLATMGYTPWGHTPQNPEALRATALAKVHDVSPETVRSRLEAMEEAGVIEGYQAYPNPRHADLTVGAYVFRPPSEDRVPDAADDLLLVDGVIEMVDVMGPIVVIVLAHRNPSERDRRLQLLGRLLDDPEPVRIFEPPMPEVERELTPLDWRIIRALRGDARRSLADVADEVGSTYRTVKRRFDRMTEEGSLFVVPRVERAKVAGLIPFTLFCILSPSAPTEVRNQLKGLFEAHLLHTLIPPQDGSRYAGLGLWAEHFAQVEEMRQTAAGLEGVERVMAVMPRKRYESDWLDTVVEQLVEGEAG